MTNRFATVAQGLNIAPTLDALFMRPDLWTQITGRQEFAGTAHHATHTVFLRMAPDWSPLALFNSTVAVDFPALAELPEIRPLLSECLALVGAVEVGRIMLVKLASYASVDRHFDGGGYAEHFDRFHLALAADTGSELIVDEEARHVAPGELVWFNHRREHFARNISPVPRIHLIIDAVAPRWRALRDA